MKPNLMCPICKIRTQDLLPIARGSFKKYQIEKQDSELFDSNPVLVGSNEYVSEMFNANFLFKSKVKKKNKKKTFFSIHYLKSHFLVIQFSI